MATTFDEIIDMGLSRIQDYKLDEVYNINPEYFQAVTDSFLKSHLSDFSCCRQSLSFDGENRLFNSLLTIEEKSILADLWVYSWLEWHINNVTQFQNVLTDNDYKRHSAAENLKQKSEYFDKIREKYSQRITEYQLSSLSNYM